MAALPAVTDPTLLAIDAALETAEAAAQRSRPYLGASQIGDACERKLWYNFRWAGAERMDAASLKRIADGHAGEALQAQRLRMVTGIELHTADPQTGGQIAVSDHGGHFRGHADGVVLGLLQAPKTWHVWEHKQCGEDKIRKLESLKASLGEKNALREWNPVYYAQAQVYMHYMGLTRHYLTAATPGGRHTVSVRTEYDAEAALRLVERARRVIFAPEPGERLSADPAWFECRLCPHADHCHGVSLPARSCRTCVFATPTEDGAWWCERHEKRLSEADQREGCPDQRLTPAIVPGRQEDAADDACWIAYALRDGRAWVDEGPQSAASYAVGEATSQ